VTKRSRSIARFAIGAGEALFEELDVQADARQGVSNLVTDVRGHAADGCEALGLDQARLGFTEAVIARDEGFDHAFEFFREPADLVVGGGPELFDEFAARDGLDAFLKAR
jgi:hypothetical protein